MDLLKKIFSGDACYIAIAIYLFFCIGDLNNHNKKIDSDFDESSPKRNEYHIGMYGFYFLLVVVLGSYIRSCN